MDNVYEKICSEPLKSCECGKHFIGSRPINYLFIKWYILCYIHCPNKLKQKPSGDFPLSMQWHNDGYWVLAAQYLSLYKWALCVRHAYTHTKFIVYLAFKFNQLTLFAAGVPHTFGTVLPKLFFLLDCPYLAKLPHLLKIKQHLPNGVCLELTSLLCGPLLSWPGLSVQASLWHISLHYGQLSTWTQLHSLKLLWDRTRPW